MTWVHPRGGHISPFWPARFHPDQTGAVPGRRARAAVPRWALASAALPPFAVIAGWAVAESFQPSSYSPLRSTISGLAGLGANDRWIMTSALVITAVCYFATAIGLPGIRVSARIVLAIAGLSSLGIAASPEPVGGSTPQHLAWTSLGEVAIAVWPAFTARRAGARPLVLRPPGAGAVTVVFLGLLAWLVFETQDGTILGLTERLVSGIQVAWPLAVALALRRTVAPVSAGRTRTTASGYPAAAAPRQSQGRQSQGRQSQGRQSQGRQSQGRPPRAEQAERGAGSTAAPRGRPEPLRERSARAAA